jgi:membrane-associated phospholipid phosphatase
MITTTSFYHRVATVTEDPRTIFAPVARRHRSRASVLAFLVVLAVTNSTSAAGQTPPGDPHANPKAVADAAADQPKSFVGTLFRNMADDIKHLPRRNSVYWLAGGAALALAAHPYDKTVNARLLGSDVADSLFLPGHIVGATETQLGATAVLYLVARHREAPKAKHLAMDLLEAQLLSEGITQVIKFAVRRERPDNTGFGFPSGHAAITMASATVLQQHLGWKAAVPTYAIAAYVASSRLHDNRHYLSDVIGGGTEGIIIGRAVTWHGRNNWGIVPVVTKGRAAIVVTRQ